MSSKQPRRTRCGFVELVRLVLVSIKRETSCTIFVIGTQMGTGDGPTNPNQAEILIY